MHGGRGERGGGGTGMNMSVGLKILMFTMATPTCTMIPFELYSLRRAAEK